MRCGDGREKLLSHRLKERHNNLYKNIIAQVATYYKIPSPKLKSEFTYREIVEMYVDVLFVEEKQNTKGAK